MPAKIYVCENCGFMFSRVGECEQCPDCGKNDIRFAAETEIEEFYARKKEFACE